MFKYHFDKRPIIENTQRVNVSVFVRQNLLELNERFKNIGKEPLNINKEEDLQLFIRIIHEKVTLNLRQENLGKLEFSEENPVRLTYSRSNLNKGFIVWFVCNFCGKKVRHLFIPINNSELACRRCHRLAYQSQNENHKQLNLLKKYYQS